MHPQSLRTIHPIRQQQTRPMQTHLRQLPTALVALSFLAVIAACGGRQQTGTDADTANNDRAESQRAAVARLTDNTSTHHINGIQLIVKHVPDAPFTHAGIYFRGGAMTWTDELLGVQDFALNVAMGAGPESMTKSEYSAMLDRTGTDMSASSGYDAATAHVDALSANFDRMFALLVDTLRNPALPESEISLVREGTLSTLRTMFDDPDSAARHTARLNAFADHPYGKVSYGSEETVSSFTADQLREALNELLVRERIVVVVAGGITPAAAQSIVADNLGDLPSDPSWYRNADGTDARQMLPLPTTGSDVRFLDREGLPTNYVLGYFSAPAGNTHRFPCAAPGDRSPQRPTVRRSANQTKPQLRREQPAGLSQRQRGQYLRHRDRPADDHGCDLRHHTKHGRRTCPTVRPP